MAELKFRLPMRNWSAAAGCPLVRIIVRDTLCFQAQLERIP
jgi:hypothetical protein